MKSPRRPHRRYTYYKIQVWEDVSFSWKDIQTAFDTLAEAKDHASRRLPSKKTRIMVVGDKSRYVLEVGEQGNKVR